MLLTASGDGGKNVRQRKTRGLETGNGVAEGSEASAHDASSS